MTILVKYFSIFQSCLYSYSQIKFSFLQIEHKATKKKTLFYGPDRPDFPFWEIFF